MPVNGNRLEGPDDIQPASDDGELEMGYQTTVMYGRYSRSLANYAKEQAAEIRQRKKEDKQRAHELLMPESYRPRGKWATRILRVTSFIWRHTFARIGEDWIFLALLGTIMAVISYAIDFGIATCVTARYRLYDEAAVHPVAQYIVWVGMSLVLVLFSVGFVSLVSPQAIGSGIPEMKTILRGVHLKEYLTFRTGLAKVVALTTALGSGLPLGKEGPLVHISSIVATMMSKMVTSFKGIYENESRNGEMLAAACAVGLSVNFAAPIGGVLFSIEVTSVYFAIRNYWRGFFSAVFGALMYRLLAFWFHREETITATYKTDFQVDFPYDPQELFIFVLMGAFGGLAGAMFVLVHRRYTLFMRHNEMISSFLKLNRFIYPTLVSVFIASLYFPQGLGKYFLALTTTRQQTLSLFSNFTWMTDDLTVEQAGIVSPWGETPEDIFMTLGIYMLGLFFLSIMAATMPVPNGSLVPIFRMGAAFGRMVGEAMHLWFPEGIRVGSILSPVVPGGYALVGAAAFSAGVTHTISICIVVCEMTGHIRHVIPIMIAVLVSNAVSSLLQPSFYESLIMIKKLPYLPDIISSNSAAYDVFVEDFMVRDIKFIWNGMTYQQLKSTMKEGLRVRSFPLVDNPTNMILLGSIQRTELVALIEQLIGRERRLQVASKRRMEARIKVYEESTANIAPIIKEPSFSRVNLITPACDEKSNREPPGKPDVRSLQFDTVKAPDAFYIHQSTSKSQSRLEEPAFVPAAINFVKERSNSFSEPRRSILKNNGSRSLLETAALGAAMQNRDTYSTVTGAEGLKLKQTLGTLLRKSSSIFDSTIDFARRGSFSSNGTPTKMPIVPVDMTPEEQKAWEAEEMAKKVDFQNTRVDPAPFQLVERTSLLKVHSIFSLMGVNHAYVTAIGKLIGVVSLKELRKAIEDVNSGSYKLHAINRRISVADVIQQRIHHDERCSKDIEHGITTSALSYDCDPSDTSAKATYMEVPKSASTHKLDEENTNVSSDT